MTKDLDIDNLSEEELASAKKVIGVERNNREGETLREAIYNRIAETLKIGDTGYSREIIFPIPLELILEDESTKKLVEDMGIISRDSRTGIEIELEEESTQGIEILNVILKVKPETNLDRIKDILQA